MRMPFIIRRTCMPTLALLVLTSACSDSPFAPIARPGGATGRLVADFVCSVDLSAETTRCEPAHAQGTARLDLYLHSPYLSFVSSFVHSRGTPADEDTTVYTIAIKNNIPQPLGTTDGTTPHPNGTRLVMTTGPLVNTVTSGTVEGASIRLDNPEGTMTVSIGPVTYPNRPYYQYDGVLAQNDTSHTEAMRIIYDSNVSSIRFAIRFWAPVQYEYGWVTITPATMPVLEPDATTTLTGIVYDAYGTALSEGLYWSTLDPGVVSVHPMTGEVTAVGEGTATVTATSNVNGQRVGRRTLTVDMGPTVMGTSPGDGAQAVMAGEPVMIHFSEPVTVSTNSFLLECPVSYESVDFTISGSGTSTITLDPEVDLPEETCTVTVQASVVSDTDAYDGPDVMALDYVFSFQVGP